MHITNKKIGQNCCASPFEDIDDGFDADPLTSIDNSRSCDGSPIDVTRIELKLIPS